MSGQPVVPEHRPQLRPQRKEDWLNRLDGPSNAPRKIHVAGAEYHVISLCKPHDCSDNNALLLYSPGQRVVYGKLLIRRRSALIGAPFTAVASELDRLWASEWRQPR